MRFRIVPLLSLFFAASASLFAQSSSVSGHVVDSQRQPIANATVDIVRTATSESNTARTNSEGFFILPPLNPGAYVMHVVAPNFGKVTIDEITLEVGGTRSFDVTLQPESQAQSVTVTAPPPELSTDSVDRGDVIESQFVQGTPLNTRNPLQIVNLSQGVTGLVSSTTSSGQNNASEAYTNTFRINGGRLASTESLLDGGANTTGYDYNAVATVPIVDAIQEFKVLTTAYAPEWGRTSGGVVTFATRSGTNTYHGSLFEYIRNSNLDAAGYNSNVAGIKKPHFERNQFGGYFGGPVLLPKLYHGKNRTFFFFTYEGLRQSQAGSFLGTVPTALERTGNFSQTRDVNGNLIVIYDPHTTMVNPAVPTQYIRTPVPGNIIPQSELNQVGLNLLKYYPLPDQAGQGQSNTNNFFSNAPTTSVQDTVNARLDHKFSDRHTTFARFDWFQRFNDAADYYHNNLAPGLNDQRLPGDNEMIKDTWVLSPTLIFEHHFVYTHQESNRVPAGYGINPTSLGFDPSVAANLRALNFPDISSATRISGLGPSSGLEHDYGTVFEYYADLIKLQGKHSLKFGVDWRYYRTGLNIAPIVTVTATSNFTGGPNPQAASGTSGSGAADILLGAATVSSGFTPYYSYYHPFYGIYAQDTYSVTKRLTLTYGLRYHLELPDTEYRNEYPYLNLSTPSPLNSQVTSLGTLTGGVGFVGVNGVGRAIQKAQTNSLDPRFGFTYRVNDKTTIRGGAGIFHAPVLQAISTSSNGFAAITTSLPTLADGVTPQFNLANPFPQGLQQPTGSSLGLNTLLGQNITGLPRQQVNSFSEQYSIEVQRELPGHVVLTAGYAGNKGIHLYVPVNFNQIPDSDLSLGSKLLSLVPNPFYKIITDATSPLSTPTIQYGQLLRPHPQFLNMTTTESWGQSEYNALQLSIEHRFSNGLALLFGYTYSRTSDDVGDYFTPNQAQDNYCLKCEWSVSGQDLTNVVRLSGQYELPFGPGKRFANNGWASQLVGGWTVGAFFTYDDGLPVAVSSPNFSNSFGGGVPERPNTTGVSTAPPGGQIIRNGALYFNPAAFSATPSYTFGNAPKYIASIRAPGADNWDILVSRRFKIKERLALDFRGEFFNAFNHVQFGGPNTSISSSSFGQIFLTQANSPRSIQGSLRLSF